MSSTTLPEEGELELEAASPEVKRYHRQKLLASVASLLLTFAALAVMAFWFGPQLNRWAQERVGESRWVRLGALAFLYGAALELFTLPLDFWSGYVLEHLHQLSNQTLAAWAWRRIKGYLVGGPLGLILLYGLYALLWFSGSWWWLWAAGAWLLATLVLGQLLPVVILPLFYKVTPLEDAGLLERLRRLTVGTRLNVQGIYRLHLSAETRKANAALAGLGRTRRVLLGDTLLDSFTPEEIEVVFAHEVGHHVHRHLPKMVAVDVALAAVSFWLADRILHGSSQALGYAAFDDPAALPLLFLVLGLFGVLLGPAQNALSRFFERQCDQYALDHTHRPDAFCSAFVKLARTNKADADPHPLVVWLFDDHPPIRQRLALAGKAPPRLGNAEP